MWGRYGVDSEDAPKTRMSCEFVTTSAHAAPGPIAGSWYAELVMNGAGGTGLGWKYGCIRGVSRFVGRGRNPRMCMCTYRLGLDQTHVMVPSVEEVVLVHDVMLACEEFTCQ